MVFLQLKAEVRNFFAPYMDMIEDKILFPYTLENQVIDNECWNENGVRVPVSKGVWLATDSIPLSVTDLFIGHSAGDIMCFCHYYPNWINFSLNRFERLSGIRAGIRTHKPKAPFETFYQSFTNGLI